MVLLVVLAAFARPFDFERGQPAAGEPRAAYLLDLELRRVAAPRAFELCAPSADVLRAIQAGNVDALVADARKFTVDPGGKWKEYTREWLLGLRASLAGVRVPEHPALTTFSSAIDVPPPPPAAAPAGDDCALGLVAAAPERGMPGRAYVSFGPEQPRPSGSESLGPTRLTVQWYWLGQVMPEANGPVYEAPAADRPGPGAWHLADIELPWSRSAGLDQ